MDKNVGHLRNVIEELFHLPHSDAASVFFPEE